MDFSYFEKMSAEKAFEYQQHFLLEVGQGFNQLANELEITPNYSFDSILQFFIWAKANLKTLPLNRDKTLPSWISNDDDYNEGLYVFDEWSRILIMRISYYFGECFVRFNEKLSWGIGKKHSAVYNMPVVTGFKKKVELAPILIVNNLCRRLIEGDELSIVNRAIEAWENNIPLYP